MVLPRLHGAGYQDCPDCFALLELMGVASVNSGPVPEIKRYHMVGLFLQ